jgi:hypothetical protein
MSNDKFCSECGSPLEPGDEFCSQCGFRLQDDEVKITEQDEIKTAGAKPRKTFSLAVTAVLIVTAAAAFYVYKKFNPGGTVKNTPGSSNSVSTAASTPSAETKAASNQKQTPAVQNTPEADYTKPDVYLPDLNKKYTYHVNYADGDTGTVDALAGHLDGAPVMTLTSIVPESEAYTQHIVSRQDGMYMVSDENPDVYNMYLPSMMVAGIAWQNNGVTFEVEKSNESCNMGFKTFDNCVVIKQSFTEAGYTFRVWYAPGAGVVKSVYADSGNPYEELTGITDMPESEMKNTLARYSPNIGKIK